jgi:hypothetical protein
MPTTASPRPGAQLRSFQQILAPGPTRTFRAQCAFLIVRLASGWLPWSFQALLGLCPCSVPALLHVVALRLGCPGSAASALSCGGDPAPLPAPLPAQAVQVAPVPAKPAPRASGPLLSC